MGQLTGDLAKAFQMSQSAASGETVTAVATLVRDVETNLLYGGSLTGNDAEFHLHHQGVAIVLALT